MSKRTVLFALLFVAACQSVPPPAEPGSETVVVPVDSVEADEAPIGTVRVTASKLNIRTAPSTDDAIVGTAKKGERLALLKHDGQWMRVKTPAGARGWVSSRLVKKVNHCPADRDFEMLDAPPLSFSQEGPHGTVIVEATVETTGKVSSTRVTKNTTGEASLADSAQQEIRRAKFSPPVRNCAAKRFIYVYTRRY